MNKLNDAFRFFHQSKYRIWVDRNTDSLYLFIMIYKIAEPKIKGSVISYIIDSGLFDHNSFEIETMNNNFWVLDTFLTGDHADIKMVLYDSSTTILFYNSQNQSELECTLTPFTEHDFVSLGNEEKELKSSISTLKEIVPVNVKRIEQKNIRIKQINGAFDFISNQGIYYSKDSSRLLM